MQVLEIDLKDNGDTYTLPSGKVLRLRIEPDDYDTVADEEDFYGKVEWSEGRPSHFDGNSEVIMTSSRGWDSQRLWWQPPTDVKRGTEQFTNLRTHLSDALKYGYVCVFVELCEGSDYYGADIVKDVEVIGGVMATDYEAIRMYANEMAEQFAKEDN
jgi:hypothetical protein